MIFDKKSGLTQFCTKVLHKINNDRALGLNPSGTPIAVTVTTNRPMTVKELANLFAGFAKWSNTATNQYTGFVGLGSVVVTLALDSTISPDQVSVFPLSALNSSFADGDYAGGVQVAPTIPLQQGDTAFSGVSIRYVGNAFFNTADYIDKSAAAIGTQLTLTKTGADQLVLVTAPTIVNIGTLKLTTSTAGRNYFVSATLLRTGQTVSGAASTTTPLQLDLSKWTVFNADEIIVSFTSSTTTSTSTTSTSSTSTSSSTTTTSHG